MSYDNTPTYPPGCETITPSDTDLFAPSNICLPNGGTVAVLSAKGDKGPTEWTLQPNECVPHQCVKVFETGTDEALLVRRLF